MKTVSGAIALVLLAAISLPAQTAHLRQAKAAASKTVERANERMASASDSGKARGAAGQSVHSDSASGGKAQVAAGSAAIETAAPLLEREVFRYERSGRRDPFLSLISSGDLRPMLADLQLTTVLYDPAGRSVAVLRDLSTKEQYRVRVGQTLGRMRVARIDAKSITFTIEEYGYSRQETLRLADPNKESSQ
ncbi:MAG TPA: hypothetical protein VNL96_11265 [Gemmatimonadaceae bacterium]|nr:hypothetical protein [Gemmatimonadaceae bacterium]